MLALVDLVALLREMTKDVKTTTAIDVASAAKVSAPYQFWRRLRLDSGKAFQRIRFWAAYIFPDS